MGVKFVLVFFVDLLFPLLQPGPGPGGNRWPITEGIILLIVGALGIGIKAFSKKSKKQ
ncbi:MAG: hypothetical protein KAR17_00685 [Cyclobacteriaceae bacterium]|nr:hypothetical protein [Cyclobacteriaceae bacterium]